MALLAASAAARAPVLAALGPYSQPVVRRGDHTAAVTGMAAALLLTAAAVAVAVAVRRRARALAESYWRSARLRDGGIVVVPGPAVEAYALPGWPGRIVVSGGLLDDLDDAGRAALLAHQQAHLAGRHHLFTTLAHLAAAASPLLLPLARAVDYTVERQADEHAAAVTGDRRLVAATIGTVALLASPRPRRPVAALGIAGPRARRVSVAWAGPGAAAGRRAARPAPAAARGAAGRGRRGHLAAVATLAAARDLDALLELARAAR